MLVSCQGTTQEVRIIHVNERPQKGVFKFMQTKIDVVCADFDNALFLDELGYPLVDFKKFDKDAPGKVMKTFDAVVL